MGREVRRVPKGWEHPKYPADHCEAHLRGRYIPLHDRSFATADADWSEGFAKWQEGYVERYGADEKWRPRTKDDGPRYSEWAGNRPSPDDYMPDWPESERTLIAMYEDTTEGTPISPAFETPEELARWLTDNGASAFGSMTATYEQWLATCKSGWAVSAVIQNGVLESGVAANL